MTNKHQKPTGEMGNVLKISDTGTSKVEQFKFPDTKDKIEKKIADLFLKLLENYGISELVDLTLEQNQEFDLDFRLTSHTNEYLLELTEFTPPGNMKGGYKKLEYSHNIGEQAQKIIDLIQKKSDKYSSISNDIILLAYITDQRSLPSISAEKIVKQYINTRKSSFKYVFLVLPIMENSGPLIKYYPNDENHLSDEIISEIKKNTVHNLRLG